MALYAKDILALHAWGIIKSTSDWWHAHAEGFWCCLWRECLTSCVGILPLAWAFVVSSTCAISGTSYCCYDAWCMMSSTTTLIIINITKLIIINFSTTSSSTSTHWPSSTSPQPHWSSSTLPHQHFDHYQHQPSPNLSQENFFRSDGIQFETEATKDLCV